VSIRGFGVERLRAGGRRDTGQGEDVIVQTMTKASCVLALIDW
jgi:hypothetical protein